MMRETDMLHALARQLRTERNAQRDAWVARVEEIFAHEEPRMRWLIGELGPEGMAELGRLLGLGDAA